MGLSKTIVRNTAATYLRFVIVLLVQFFTFPYLYNTLGKDVYGIYGFFWAVAGYMVLLDLGFSSAVVKYVAKCRAVADWNSLNRTLNTIFGIYLAFGIVSLLLSGVVILMLPLFHNFRVLSPDMLTNARLAFAMIGLNVAMVLILNIFKSMLVGLQRLDLVNFAEAAIQVLYGISIFAFIHGPRERASQNLLIATASFTAATFVTGLAYILMTWRVFPHARISLRLFDRTQLRELFSFSAAVVVLRIAIIFTYGTDQITLGIFATLATVAIYQIAVRTSEMVRTFVSSASNVFEPLVSELHSTKRSEDLGRLYLLFTKMSFSVGLPIVMLAMIFLQPFIVAWTLETNQTIPWVLAVLLLVALLDLTHISASKVLLMTEKHWYQTKVWVVSSLSFVAASVIVVNVMPAAWAARIGVSLEDAKMLGIALIKLACLVSVFYIIMSYTFAQVYANWRAFFGKCILPVLLAAVPAAAVGVALRLYSYPLIYYMEKGEQHVNRAHSLLNIAWQGALAFAVYVVAWWFIALTREERTKFASVFHSYLRKLRGQPATPESPA
jgi:O-antigen/teichoic acid export membrane protein